MFQLNFIYKHRQWACGPLANPDLKENRTIFKQLHPDHILVTDLQTLGCRISPRLPGCFYFITGLRCSFPESQIHAFRDANPSVSSPAGMQRFSRLGGFRGVWIQLSLHAEVTYLFSSHSNASSDRKDAPFLPRQLIPSLDSSKVGYPTYLFLLSPFNYNSGLLPWLFTRIADPRQESVFLCL